jgi:hypothetical protein
LHTTLLSLFFSPSVSSQNINKTQTPIQQTYRHTNRFVEIVHHCSRFHKKKKESKQQADIKLKKLENPCREFCEIGDFVSWKALPEENESARRTECGV